ncbi:MAG TPA: polysaccharide deacetylase family protein [Allosphingosinicella sp.]
MTGPGERPPFPKRRDDRNRRVRRWATRVAAGGGVGFLLAFLLGGAAGVLCAAAGLAIGLAAGHPFMIAPPGVPILTYHSVSPDSSWLPWADEIAVHPDTLRAHLDTIRKMGCTIVSTAALVEARREGRPLPDGAIALHFDDGYADNWLFAAPILREAGAPATFFASLDFVAPGGEPREATATADYRGYMNWAELRALDQEPLFDVEPHGIDHGRVAVSARAVNRLTRDNWRSLAWMQWAKVPGDKHDWYLWTAPPAVPLGSAVPESEGALAAAAYEDGKRETGEGYRGRVTSHLGRCASAWRERLGRDPSIFCWPENRVSAAAREVAAELGYSATTAGSGRNTRAEPACILSRIHAGDRALGFRFGPAERLRIRAAIRLFQGNHYWWLISAPMDLVRRIAMRTRRGPSK